MDSQELRLKCLEMAQKMNPGSCVETIVQDAQKLYDFTVSDALLLKQPKEQ